MTDRSFLEIKEKTKSKSIEVHSDALRCSAHSAGVHSECHSEWTWKVALTLALALQSQVECFELCSTGSKVPGMVVNKNYLFWSIKIDKPLSDVIS